MSLTAESGEKRQEIASLDLVNALWDKTLGEWDINLNARHSCVEFFAKGAHSKEFNAAEIHRMVMTKCTTIDRRVCNWRKIIIKPHPIAHSFGGAVLKHGEITLTYPDFEVPKEYPLVSSGTACDICKEKDIDYVLFVQKVSGAVGLPQGRCDMDKKETTHECAIRETKEEAGIGLTGLAPKWCNTVNIDQGTYREILDCWGFYLPIGSNMPVPVPLDKSEIAKAFWRPVTEALEDPSVDVRFKSAIKLMCGDEDVEDSIHKLYEILKDPNWGYEFRRSIKLVCEAAKKSTLELQTIGKRKSPFVCPLAI